MPCFEIKAGPIIGDGDRTSGLIKSWCNFIYFNFFYPSALGRVSFFTIFVNQWYHIFALVSFKILWPFYPHLLSFSALDLPFLAVWSAFQLVLFFILLYIADRDWSKPRLIRLHCAAVCTSGPCIKVYPILQLLKLFREFKHDQTATYNKRTAQPFSCMHFARGYR